MVQLNYHHLRYFHQVAESGHLGRAAEKLNVSASALSIQIKQLEHRLGHALFTREGRGLVLTEAGHIALDHAGRIFGAGDDLLAALDRRAAPDRPLRVGALSTLSRNFQMQFLAPLLEDQTLKVVLTSGTMTTLLSGLQDLSLDVVLSTEIPPGVAGLAAQRITEQPVGLHGRPDRLRHDTLADTLAQEPLILPTDKVIRTGFENLIARLGAQPHVVAEVDDMAMVRLLARAGVGLAVAPAVVLADEIASGTVASAPFDLDLVEPFYALTLPRQFPHPMLGTALAVQTGAKSARA